jgi:hypothetical protein
VVGRLNEVRWYGERSDRKWQLLLSNKIMTLYNYVSSTFTH